MPASRTYVGEMDVQFLTTIVSPNQDTSTLFRAAMHRVLDSRLGMLERQCQASSIKARSRLTIFAERSSFILPKSLLQGLRTRTASRMRTFIWSLDVEEFTSLILLCLHRFKWDCACAPLCACVVSFQLWEPKRTHRSGLPQEPITVPYIADIIIAWIYLALLLYRKVSSDDVISC